MSSRYNLTYVPSLTPPEWYWEYLKEFPGSFTKEEIISKYGISEKTWKKFRAKYCEVWYDPREQDHFRKFRGMFYNPDHKLNLVTGWPEQQLKADLGPSYNKLQRANQLRYDRKNAKRIHGGKKI